MTSRSAPQSVVAAGGGLDAAEAARRLQVDGSNTVRRRRRAARAARGFPSSPTRWSLTAVDLLACAVVSVLPGPALRLSRER